MEGGARIVKFLVFFFNFIFFVLGITLVGVGAWAKVKFGDYAVLSQKVDYVTGTNLLIAVGVIITLVAFFGCCGAWKENKCFLIIFFILLLVILCLEIAAAYLGYSHRSKIATELRKELKDEIRTKYGEEGETAITDAFDKIQQQEKCCGAQNYTDWQTSAFANGSHVIVPDSCCRDMKTDCGDLSKSVGKPINETIYTEGCDQKLVDLVKDKLYYVGALAITILVFQILGMIFALVLICQIGKGETYA